MTKLEELAGLPEVLPKGAHECHCEICPEYCMGDCVCGGACYCTNIPQKPEATVSTYKPEDKA